MKRLDFDIALYLISEVSKLLTFMHYSSQLKCYNILSE